MSNTSEQREVEIQLIDLLRILWKWKIFIFGVTIVCVIVTVIYNYTSPKVYSIESIIQPGILRVNEDGTYVYLDSVENIKALIEEGTFNYKILGNFKKNEPNSYPQTLRFKVTSPRDSDTIKVRYETSNTRQGVNIQKELNQLVFNKYNNLMEYFRNEYDTQLRIKDNAIDNLKANIISYENNTRNLNTRITELQSEVQAINRNTGSLTNERERFLSNTQNEDGILSALLYSNTIQQNLALVNELKDSINEYRMEKETETIKLNASKKQMDEFIELRNNLAFKKENVQNIQVLQPPTINPFPIRPKTMINVLLAFTFGIVISLCMSFFIEYIQSKKQ